MLMDKEKNYILGIETSCDETAASVVDSGRMLISSKIASQIDVHKLYGGVVPEIASREHLKTIVPVVDQALKDAGITAAELKAIAVTVGPGLVGALLVGVSFAKSYAAAISKPLIPVHHIEGHIASVYLSDREVEPPFLCQWSPGVIHIYLPLMTTRSSESLRKRATTLPERHLTNWHVSSVWATRADR